MFCKFCGHSIDNETKFCESCGKTVESTPKTADKAYCFKCGSEWTAINGKYLCSQCGNFVDLTPKKEIYTPSPNTNTTTTYNSKPTSWAEYSPEQKKKYITIFTVTFIICLVIIIPLCFIDCGGSSPSSKITYSNYNKIQIGMSYSQVVDILGDGKLTADSYIEGYGTISGYKYQCYEWSKTYPDVVIINIWFKAGIVESKYQAGL